MHARFVPYVCFSPLSTYKYYNFAVVNCKWHKLFVTSHSHGTSSREFIKTQPKVNKRMQRTFGWKLPGDMSMWDSSGSEGPGLTVCMLLACEPNWRRLRDCIRRFFKHLQWRHNSDKTKQCTKWTAISISVAVSWALSKHQTTNTEQNLTINSCKGGYTPVLDEEQCNTDDNTA